MTPIEYLGCFFDPQDMQELPLADRQGPLYRSIAAPHVTFIYAPSHVPYALFGMPVTVKVTGYGCNMENEALRIELLDLPLPLQPLAGEIPIPHITLSVAKTAQPVNSRYLEFHSIRPFLLHGRFGGMDVEGNVHTESFHAL